MAQVSPTALHELSPAAAQDPASLRWSQIIASNPHLPVGPNAVPNHQETKPPHSTNPVNGETEKRDRQEEVSSESLGYSFRQKKKKKQKKDPIIWT